MSNFVTLEGVDLRYGGSNGVLALSGTDMAIKRGEFAAVVGPSGCGKSSLMKLVTGLTPASAGRITVADQDVSGPLKCVGMAFQNPTLLPWRKLLSNVMLPLEIVQPHRRRLSGAPSLGTLRRHAAAREPLPRAHSRAGSAYA
jgi:NitT/TauT family transport system ATP-binding protein